MEAKSLPKEWFVSCHQNLRILVIVAIDDDCQNSEIPGLE